MIACAASGPPSRAQRVVRRVDAGEHLLAVVGEPIRPVEQTTTSMAPAPRCSATRSATAWVVWKPSGPV